MVKFVDVGQQKMGGQRRGGTDDDFMLLPLAGFTNGLLQNLQRRCDAFGKALAVFIKIDTPFMACK